MRKYIEIVFKYDNNSYEMNKTVFYVAGNWWPRQLMFFFSSCLGEGRKDARYALVRNSCDLIGRGEIGTK